MCRAGATPSRYVRQRVRDSLGISSTTSGCGAPTSCSRAEAFVLRLVVHTHTAMTGFVPPAAKVALLLLPAAAAPLPPTAAVAPAAAAALWSAAEREPRRRLGGLPGGVST